MAISKVIYAGEVKLDLTSDTVTADALAEGVTAHGRDGEIVIGVSTKDVDSSSATATDSEVLLGQTYAAGGAMHTGKMPNNGAVSLAISTKAGKATVPQGYHDGSGTVQISSDEQAKLIPTNIREGITVLGVKGTMSGTESVKAQARSVTPSARPQTIAPELGYNYLSQVTVEAIPYVESKNPSGGMTVTIG